MPPPTQATAARLWTQRMTRNRMSLRLMAGYFGLFSLALWGSGFLPAREWEEWLTGEVPSPPSTGSGQANPLPGRERGKKEALGIRPSTGSG